MTDKTKQLLESMQEKAVLSRHERVEREKAILSNVLDDANRSSHELNKNIFNSVIKAFYLAKKSLYDICIEYDNSFVEVSKSTNDLTKFTLHLKGVVPKELDDIFAIKKSSSLSDPERDTIRQKKAMQTMVSIPKLNVITKFNKENSDKIMIFNDKYDNIHYYLFNVEEFKKLGFDIYFHRDGSVEITSTEYKLSNAINLILDQKVYNNQKITMEDMKPIIKTYQAFQNQEQFIENYKKICDENLQNFEFKMYRLLIESYLIAKTIINNQYRIRSEFMVLNNDDLIKRFCKEDDITLCDCFANITKQDVVFIHYRDDKNGIYYPIIYRDLINFISYELKDLNGKYEINKGEVLNILKVSVDSLAFENLLINKEKEKIK